MTGKQDVQNTSFDAHNYVVEPFDIRQLTFSFILGHSAELLDTGINGFYDLEPEQILLNQATFQYTSGNHGLISTGVKIENGCLTVSCSCNLPKRKLCPHQVRTLLNIINRKELLIFFDAELRLETFKTAAKDYGLQEEKSLEQHFTLEYHLKNFKVKPKRKELLAVNEQTTAGLKQKLFGSRTNAGDLFSETTKQVLVLGKHKYYNQLSIELYEAQTTQSGAIKNPLRLSDPFDLIWKTEQQDELKFFTAITKFKTSFNETRSESDLQGLKALAKNPLNLDVYIHDNERSPNVTSTSLTYTRLRIIKTDIRLTVDLKDGFYTISGVLMLNDKALDLALLAIRFNYFVQVGDALYLADSLELLRVLEFFKQNNNTILVHESKYEEFRQNILKDLEQNIRITYSYLKQATKKQLQETGFNYAPERIIYLSEAGNYVEVTPVIKYGEVEIPVLSRRQIYATDHKGNAFLVQRDEQEELQFTSLLLRQHPDFYEQLNHSCFHLHKQQFLNEEWFLNAFEDWRNLGITVLGFNTLKNNKINPYKVSIHIHVKSGINWFDTEIDARFGKQKVKMKALHKSIRNKSKFVQLDDGTMGILPAEWINKFTDYFNAGEVVDETLRTSKINFSDIIALYDKHMLSEEVSKHLTYFTHQIAHFEEIEKAEVPVALETTLREYQQQGLNWLNFLDGFGFGACLADDMGLGKTVQVIAFILSQRNKGHKNTNLIVVPTSLIFNWQAEIARFAPSVKVLTIYGTDRTKNTMRFDEYEVILTSYGTLQSDIRYLKDYHFNYVVLDESQAIKNPDSLRYKTVCLLQSRNKIVLTGTPVENNTYDLYGQLSFACPGLLGSRQHFKELYADPIDQFKDSKRAIELQRKINPFVLRRTKEQVAPELPDKTEMVIYCEMGEEQRKIYRSTEEEIRRYIESKDAEELPESSMFVLQGITRLRQICNSPQLLKDDVFYGDASSKIEVLMEEIANKAPHHKILVFSQFVGMLDLIRKQLEVRNISYEYLTGQTRNRSSKVESFQNNKEVRVFLISLKAGGTGLNLTEADYVYLVDPWWNPAVENQAIDRSYRIGQKKNVVAVRLICPDTVEDKMMKLQQTKKELASDLVKTDASVFKSLSKDDLLGLFGGG